MFPRSSRPTPYLNMTLRWSLLFIPSTGFIPSITAVCLMFPMCTVVLKPRTISVGWKRRQTVAWKYWQATGWLLLGLMATIPLLSCELAMSRARAALCWALTRRQAALFLLMLDTCQWTLLVLRLVSNVTYMDGTE